MQENKILQQLRRELRRYASPKQALVLQRFFKTGPGEYGEGDRFIGVKVPQIRKVATNHHQTPGKDILGLLGSKIHEERLLALIILTIAFKKSDDVKRKQIYLQYLKNTAYINNWDLVDLSSHEIVGAYLLDKPRSPLYGLAKSASLWERRIAIVSTYHFIKNGEFSDTLRIATILLADKEDLIHKAAGWMLREVGKRDKAALDAFIARHACKMPRTMLRYAIERFPEKERQRILQTSR